MQRDNIIAGLDMGGGKVTCILASHDSASGTLKVLSGKSLECKGLKGGVVVDIRATSDVITRVIEAAEAEAKCQVSGVSLGVRGVHLNSLCSHGAYNIARPNKEITEEDIQAAIENAKAIPIKSDREILHVVPLSFSIDRQPGVPNPEGMEGSLLEVDIHTVTASASHLGNITKAVAQAGFSVEETTYSLLAMGETVLTNEEKELGAVLLDMGGETISVGIYVEGGIRFSKDIPYGCDLITRDIAYGLHTSREVARQIKEKHGSAVPSLTSDDEEINVPSMDRRTSHSIKTSFLSEIIQPRVEELFEIVRDEIKRTRYADVPGICVLSGGGSMMRGTAEICSQILSMREVRLGGVNPDHVLCDSEFLDPLYSGALAIVLYSGNKYSAGGFASPAAKKPVFDKLSDFFKSFDVFGKE